MTPAALAAHALTPGGRNVITTTHRRLIRQARAAGLRIREIAAALNVATTTVVKYSSDDAERRLAEYQRVRPMSDEERERRRRRAYARWVAGRVSPPT